MKRTFLLSLIFLINIQLFGTIVSPKSYLTDFQNHTLFLKSSIFKQTTPQDTGQATIITTKGDTIQATILRVTKIAYKIKYKKVKHKKSGTVTKIKSRKLRKSIIQKIIYPDGRTINVAQKFKTVVEKKIKKLFFCSLIILVSTIILFIAIYFALSYFWNIPPILPHLIVALLSIYFFIVFFSKNFTMFKYNKIAIFDFKMINFFTISLIIIEMIYLTASLFYLYILYVYIYSLFHPIILF